MWRRQAPITGNNERKKHMLRSLARWMDDHLRAQATDVAEFFFSGYSSDADMFGSYTTMGMIIIMSALASLTPL